MRTCGSSLVLDNRFDYRIADRLLRKSVNKAKDLADRPTTSILLFEAAQLLCGFVYIRYMATNTRVMMALAQATDEEPSLRSLFRDWPTASYRG
jgi:hypothetical protein